MGPEVHESEAKKQRRIAAESNIKSLLHYNNEVRRLKDEIMVIKDRINQLRQKGDPTEQWEDKLFFHKSDLAMYESLVSKVNTFLDKQDPIYKKAIIDKYVNNKTFANIALSMDGMSETSLKRVFDEILSKFY
ncbi:hypothetical protein LJC02_01830 [Breznakia sp. OttesenSCG-928-G09]|nr:hypothetical protein [Breznakia sp. OttesenSCG-928-G09]